VDGNAARRVRDQALVNKQAKEEATLFVRSICPVIPLAFMQLSKEPVPSKTTISLLILLINHPK
jgi:hypothetical protein